MSFPLLKNFSAIANLVSLKSFPSSSSLQMHTTRLSTAKRGTNPSAESNNPDDDPAKQVRVFVRKKRAAKTVQAIVEATKPEIPDEKPCSLPEIEDFAYGKQSSFSRSNEVQPPANWVKVIEGIRKMRSSEDAPVDSMGCEKAGVSLPPKVAFTYYMRVLNGKKICSSHFFSIVEPNERSSYSRQARHTIDDMV
ncbi:hypothetical protein SASPL_124457 [Salvia splendens]|uniref:Uncharacterized protein n=1 Tax=Salvia splendens TaxID=180675 RepID=A0A8X8XT25_SALSN|nr:hypothetical protein SASPL_124457 [Salvia splendens]